MFRDRFFVSLILTISVVLYSGILRTLPSRVIASPQPLYRPMLAETDTLDLWTR
jgi:hypothetical protein